MKKHLFFSTLILILFQNNAFSQNVGVGTTTPAFRLDVQGDPVSTLLTNLNSKVNYSGNLNIKALEGTSITADGWGIGGSFIGGNRGADCIAQGGAYTGWTYGISGSAIGTTGHRAGVLGTASGGQDNYGVYGYADGGANNIGVFGQNLNLTGYAGYFDGRGLFKYELRADKNLVVMDTTWTHRIWNTSGIFDLRAISDIQMVIDRNNAAGTSSFLLSNGTGSQIFSVSETGASRSFGNHYVDGNLGIGTTAPATKLHIPVGADASYTTHGFIETGITNGWNMVIDDNEILARNNGLENEMFIQRDGGDLLLCSLELGSVGIGLTAGSSIPAGYMLAVDGKIIAEEMRIQNSTNWPDYVFANDYHLLSLDELKQSIQVNKHLPNIPSAEAVSQDGILIGDMQKKLMEKIEELTLYILDMHEVNKNQQAEIDELKSSLVELKKK